MKNNSFEVKLIYAEDGRLKDWIYSFPNLNSQDHLSALLSAVRDQQEPLQSEVDFTPVTKEAYDADRIDTVMDEHPMWATPEKEFEYRLAAFLDENMTPQKKARIRMDVEKQIFGPTWEEEPPSINWRVYLKKPIKGEV